MGDELENGTRVSVLVGEDWVTGTFIGHVEDMGQDWVLLDIVAGEPPRRINTGFISDIQEHPTGEVIPFRPRLVDVSNVLVGI